MNSKNILPVDQNVHRGCDCHKCNVKTESGNKQNSSGRFSFIKRLFSTGALRFAGWWSIFAGALAVNSVCPVCGSQGCPVGIGTTGIIAAFFAATKQWGGIFLKKIRDYIRSGVPKKNEEETSCR
ncbi:MAG TPA: hypothetical protein PK358_05550 [Spirochaetota bacterium]|nr:hypothetical protein [Spirochaetota bacterium]HPJ34279.1 hypothetical protein [Spirochaetota bacterium]